MNREDRLDELLDEILKRHLQPEDPYEVAALVESMGWNDERAAEVFGSSTVFELANELWNRRRQRILFTPFSKPEKINPWRLLVELTRNFLRGAIFALPMAVSVLSMLTLKFSLWSYQYLAVDLATAIAIGTILSFMTVGGFMQSIARRGFFYITQGYYAMGRKITFYFIRRGIWTSLLVSLFIILFNLTIKLFPFRLIWVILFYYCFLNVIWLSVTVMYILQKEIVFTGLILLGIGIVYGLFVLLKVNIIVSQLLALMIVALIGFGLVVHFFHLAEKKAEKGIAPKLPRMSIMLYNTMPYFVYGLLYFTFLFVDRVIAWSTNDINMPYPIWFRGDYEVGLDFALLMLILPMGISEVVLYKLMRDIEASQKQYSAARTMEMNDHYLGVYYRRLILMILVSLASAITLYQVSTYLILHYKVTGAYSLFYNQITHEVYLWALLSYVIVASSLMNAVILFSLSCPNLVNKAIWPALLVNMITGFLLTRWIHYSYAVFGLLAGSAVFFVFSTVYVRKALKRLDYLLYAAT